MPDYRFNKVYSPIFTTDATEIDITGGRGRGGSHFVTDYFRFLINQPAYFRGYFMRLVHGDIRESLYRDFKDRIEEDENDDLNNYSFSDQQMSIVHNRTGNQIHSKGFRKSQSSRTAKLKSIAGATHIAIEEFEEVEQDDYMKLSDSLRTTKVKTPQILRIWNPPNKDHWIIKRWYDIVPAELEDKTTQDYFYYVPKGEKGHLCFYSNYKDNLININESTRLKWEAYKITHADHYYSDIRGLVSSGIKGVIYKTWKKYKQLPEGITYKLFGCDFGFENSKTALVEINIEGDKKVNHRVNVYVKEHLYRIKVTNPELIAIIKEVNPDKHEVVCDNAEPGDIAEMQMAGIEAIKTKKGGKENLVYHQVKMVLDHYNLHYHYLSENCIFEANNYKWAINPDTKEPMNKPEKKFDDTKDAERYAIRYYHLNYGI